jgi:hypothetical protein
MNRRNFLKMFSAGATLTAAGLLVPELLKPDRRIWQVGASIGSRRPLIDIVCVDPPAPVAEFANVWVGKPVYVDERGVYTFRPQQSAPVGQVTAYEFSAPPGKIPMHNTCIRLAEGHRYEPHAVWDHLEWQS